MAAGLVADAGFLLRRDGSRQQQGRGVRSARSDEHPAFVRDGFVFNQLEAQLLRVEGDCLFVFAHHKCDVSDGLGNGSAAGEDQEFSNDRRRVLVVHLTSGERSRSVLCRQERGGQRPGKFRQETSDANDNLIQHMKIKPVQNRGGVLVELGPQEAQLPAPTTTGTSGMLVFKLKEMLVPVDFTECTEKALAYAVPFARQFGATIILLHVIEPAFVPASEMGLVVEVDTSHETRRELERLRTRVASQVRCQTLVRRGSAEQEIIAVAKELACDLIILSTHGRSGLDRLLMGSTAERVVRRAGCPIFIVRPHEHDFIANDPTDWQEDAESLETEIEAEMRAGI